MNIITCYDFGKADEGDGEMYPVLKKNLGLILFNLRMLAGFKDTVALLLFSTTTGVHTGNLSRFVRLLFTGDIATWVQTVLILLAFFMGTVVNGFFFHARKFEPSYKQGRFYTIFGVIMLVFSFIDISDPYIFTFIAFTLGFQNAFSIHYDNQVVRTTLLSSSLTKVGELTGSLLRGDADVDDRFEIRFQIYNIFLFLLGVALASVLYFYTRVNLVFMVSIADFVTALILYKSAYDYEKAQKLLAER